MSTLRIYDFEAKFNSKLGIKTRVGGPKAIKVPQKDIEDNDLIGVSEQSFRLTSKGTKLTHKFAFLREFNSYAQVIENVLSGTTDTRALPAPYKALDDFEMSIDQLPEAVLATEKKGKIIDVEYIKENESGVLEEVKLVGSTYYKLVYNQEQYKEHYNSVGKAYVESQADGQDDAGFYKLTFSQYQHVFTLGIGLFNGHQINDRGDKVAGTEGTFMVVGARDASNFYAGNATKSGVSFTVKSVLNSVLGHPTYGVVNSSDITAAGLPQGFFKVDKGVKIAIYDAEGNVAGKFNGEDGRLGYKLAQFRPKVSRTTTEVTEEANNLATTETENKESIANELNDL